MPDVTPVKRENGVPQRLFSCHTGLVDGYVIEGHVPAEDVRRLLDERPDVAGISVPGMPVGSPGMEGPRSLYREYPVVSFTDDGEGGALQHPQAVTAAGDGASPGRS